MPPSASLTLKRRKKKQRQKQRRQSEAQTAAGGWGSHRSSSSDGETDSQGGAAVGVPLAPGVAHAAGILKLDERVLRLNDLGFDEEELGFTADDLDAALRVVEALGQDIAAFRSQPFKELRTAMHPIIEEQLKHYGVKGGALKRKRNQRNVAEITSLKEQDKEWVNRAALRAKRLAQLEELNKAAPVMGNGQPLLLTHMGEVEEAVMQIKMHRVADGAVDMEEDEVEEAAKQGAGRRLNIPINCYTCKRPFRDLHFFYDQLCPACAALNYQKRNETVDLTGRVALVTGARVKIGYRIALKLLRCGATVIATSRFAVDCARRYAGQKDFQEWRDRLHCFGLDFRDLSELERFCAFLKRSFARLDIIINNACQTIRRPTQYYQHLLLKERAPPDAREPAVCALLGSNETFRELHAGKTPLLTDDSAGAGTSRNRWAGTRAKGLPGICIEVIDEKEDAEDASERESLTAVYDESSAQPRIAAANKRAEMSQLVVLAEDLERDTGAFPVMQSGEAVLDVNEQQLDLRSKNSWTLKLDEVSTGELAEVMAINAIAPSVINARLKSLLEASPEKMRFIVNVSAMEGKFYRYKSDQHPHTNMAKAALNMMTRTSAQDYVREKAAAHGERHNFQTPIDEIDAAARVLDPIIAPLLAAQEEGQPVEPPSGVFLKDFVKCEW